MNAVKTKSVKLNMIMNALLTMSTFIFPLITFPYVSRILSPEGTGKVSLATSIISYFTMVAQLGVPTYGIRACAKVRDNKEEMSRIAHEIMFINLIMCIFVYTAFFIMLGTVPKFQERRTILLVVSITILLNSIGVEWLYKGVEQYTYITVRSIIFKFIAVIMMFIFIHKKEDYIIYGAISIFASSASNILNFINLRKYIYMHPVGNYHIKRHLKMIVVFFAMSVATTIYTHLDTVMLGFMKTETDVGYYAAAVKIKTILVSLVTAASGVLLPRMTTYVENKNKEEFYKISKKTMNFVLIIASVFSLYFMLFAKEGIFFLSGEAYEGAIIPMQVIMPTLVLIGATNILGIQIMVPIGKELQVLYSEIAGAIVDLIINIILIPKMGATGAAIGTLIAEAVVLVWQYFAIKDVSYKIMSSIKYGKITLALLFATVASLWIKLITLPTFVTLFISGVLFFATYIGSLLYMKESLVCGLTGEVLTKIKNRRAHK